MKRGGLLIVCLLIVKLSMLNGQLDLHSYFTTDIYQHTNLNPAHSITSKFNVALGGVYYHLGYTGASFDDLIDIENQTGLFNATLALETAKERNFLRSNLDVETIQIAFRQGKHCFSSGHSVKIWGFAEYPKEFVELLALGNSAFIGETVSAGPQFDATSLQEFYLGYSWGSEKFRIGTRVKLIFGNLTAATASHRIDFTTNPEYYQWQFDNDFVIHSNEVLQLSDLGDIAIDFELKDIGEMNFNNRGFAYDFGVEGNFLERFPWSAAVLNIGKIKWNYKQVNYSSQGELSYNGVDIIDYIDSDSSVVILDSLYNVLKFEESNESFETTLPLRFVGGLTYSADSSWTLGSMFYFEHFKNANHWAIAFNANKKLSKQFNVSVQYSIQENYPFNIGFSTVWTPGVFQLYMLTDNILGLVNPTNNRNANIRVGFNFLF